MNSSCIISPHPISLQQTYLNKEIKQQSHERQAIYIYIFVGLRRSEEKKLISYSEYVYIEIRGIDQIIEFCIFSFW